MINIIKVGGAIVENDDSLTLLLRQFAAIPGMKILVHGGGRSATKIASSIGVESHMIGGRRITDAEMLKVVTMVYGGLINKTIVAKLQSLGVNATGLTGADMDVIRSHKRPLKKITMDDGHEEMVDFGFVGDVNSVNEQALYTLLEQNFVPVLAPLTHDGNGNILNTNADTIAASVAKVLASKYDVTLTYCFEKAGVLRDADDDGSVIHEITASSYTQLKNDGVISGGMIPKLDNAFNSLNGGVNKVIITSYKDIEGSNGTTIVS